MKNTFILYTALAICIAINSGCKKDNSVTNPIDSEKPLVTLVGTPTGPAVTASIDASGGTLPSADGMLQLIVPAGAVSSATTFSIQPITNHCPGGIAGAYRLLPEGITFAQPVTINLFYSDTVTANEEYLSIAFQDTDKTWFAWSSSTIDTTINRISVNTKHFCSFAFWSKLKIIPVQGIVKVNESLDLEVILVGQTRSTTDRYGDELVNLAESVTFVSDWGVEGSGNGQMVRHGDNKTEYIAPTAVPPNGPFVLVWAILPNVTLRMNGLTFPHPKVVAIVRIIDNALRFNVLFTSRTDPIHLPWVDSWFAASDIGSMTVIIENGKVTVGEYHNEDCSIFPAVVKIYNCTYTILKSGDGWYNILSDVTFTGNYDQPPLVTLTANKLSYGLSPTYKEQCSIDTTKYTIYEGESHLAFPGGFMFYSDKDFQEQNTIIPDEGIITGRFLNMKVIKW